jgi:hypothetical protein
MRLMPLLLLAACAGPTSKPDSDEPVDSEPVDSEPVDSDEPLDSETVVEPDQTWTFGEEQVGLTLPDPAATFRSYTLSTTQALRDGSPTGGSRTFTEPNGAPRLRSGHLLLDALFALAAVEAREASVTAISDGSFANGQPLPCDCFETGASWTYVWTRDTAYAAHLGLAAFDPSRTRRSLEFKLSAPKAGGPLQIVQDTGSGGSWPVSTDRAVWALGARQVLNFLDGPEREAFRDLALEAMATTITIDRQAIYDPRDGLYRGEQSFLDWREQSYPSWTADDTVHLASSKALSTNAAHHALLTTAADLAEEAGDPRAATWRAWAEDLGAAVQDRLWLEEDGLPSSLIATELDPTPLRKWDQLGLSLAVLEGLLTPDQAARAVRNYPHTTVGPPVIWPQQPSTPIYHNRALWPFVTAYGLLAAREVGNDAVFDHDLDSLVRGAALNLSNMENHEFLTQAPWVDAGAESGPVVNSRRQLWSVAGFLGAFVHGLFGVEASAEGLRLRPFLTRGLRAGWLAETDTVSLLDLGWRGQTLDLHLHLPPDDGLSGGALALERIEVDGVAFVGDLLTPDDLAAHASIDLYLVQDPTSTADTVRIVPDTGDHRAFWAPPEPVITSLEAVTGGLQLTWQGTDEAGVVFHVYRDGQRVASDLTTRTWQDQDAAPDTTSPCYAVEAEYTVSTHISHHSPPVCWWGDDRIVEAGPHDWYVVAGSAAWSTDHGRAHLGDWGAAQDVLGVWTITPRWTGDHLLQLVGGNGAHAVNTGITAAVKRVTVSEAHTDAIVAEGVLTLPQLGAWDRWGESTFLPLSLQAGVAYRVELSDHPNMSYLEHFRAYTGGPGGGDSSYNAANLHGLKLLPLRGTPGPSTAPALTFDGLDDLAEHDPAQQLTADDLGGPLDPWNAFALSWDETWLYLTLVSSSFEEDYAPWMVYLEATDGPPGPAVPSSGSPYTRGVVQSPAALPFTPTHQLTLRAADTFGPQGGPWNGLWDNTGTQVRRLAPDLWLSTDRHTLSVRVRRADLGDPSHLRLAAHVIWGIEGAPWSLTIPPGHDPATDGGDWYEIGLEGDPAIIHWQIRP